MKTLITGARGILGSYIPRLEGNIYTDKRELDITNYSKVKEFIEKEKPEVIIHLASMLPRCEDKDLMCQVNVKATENLVKVARDNGLKKFVFTSTCAVYKQDKLKPTKEDENVEPQSLYGATKLLAEEAILREFDKAVIFRIFNIYGGGFRHSLVNKLVAREKVSLYSPEVYYRDYVYFRDVVSAILEAVEKPVVGSEVYNLASGVVRNTQELIDALECLGYDLNYGLMGEGSPSYSWGDNTKMEKDFLHTPRKGLVIDRDNSSLELIR